MKNLPNSKKNFLLALTLSFGFIATAFYIQLRAQQKVAGLCSYLDPIAIDIAAFSLGVFLVLEGSFKMYEEKDEAPTKQFTRAVRIALGCAIITLHTMQFIHK